jgi:N-acetylmuramoyl-L-alanine amidase
MKKENQAITRLTNSKSKVSSHYLIKNNGEILTLVPDLYVAWHAGVSSWKNYKSINKYSIGIEISNPGHEYSYKKFSKKQIKSIIKLSIYLKKKYKIKSNFILGHSDIAPDRKKDPGEKFPWKYLSKNKIGQWHYLNEKKLFKKRNRIVDRLEKNKFIKNLYKIGYPKNILFNKYKYSKLLTTAFQRRFRQELVNGIIDQECLFISNNLAKNLK